MVSRLHKLIIVLCTALGLTACMETGTTMHFINEKEVQTTTRIAVDADAFAEYLKKNKLESNPYCQTGSIAGFKIVEKKEGRDVVCVMSGKLTMLQATQQMQANLAQQGHKISLDKVGDKTYHFKLSLNLEDIQKAKEQQPDKSKFTKIIKQLFKGRELKYVFRSAKIISTSGSITKDGKTATVIIPLDEAFAGDKSKVEHDIKFSL